MPRFPLSKLHNAARRKLALLIATLVLVSLPAFGQVPAQPQARTTGFLLKAFKDETGTHKYSVFVPHGYTPAKKWPVILFLHGAGERGTDGLLPTTIGLGPLVRDRAANFPFVVVFPQCEDMHGRLLTAWSPDNPDGQRALKILEQVEKDYSIDAKREVLSGWSMGGYGAWELAAKFPERWLSVVPMSGGGDTAWAEKLKNVPLWAWHGARDRSVRPDQSRKMIEAIRAAGGNPRYTELAEGDHNVWMQGFDDDSLYAWMLSPKSDPATLRPVTARAKTPAGQPAPAVSAQPFIPALDMPRAGYVRLGNDALAAVADSVPKIVPPGMLTGRLADIQDYTEAQGYGFSVYMSGIYYQAHLSRASIKAYRKDRLNVQLGLSNAQVTIGGTSLSGERHSAQAGPISVVIGHRRPVWLSIDVTPVIVDRKLRFKHVGSRFSIPNDNWYVTAPAGVSTRGFGMTEEKVSSGLVSGLYGKKGMIEQKVEGIVPQLIAELEKKVDEALATKSMAGAWPLPVYQPQLRVWPGEVSTDEQGVSLVMGATAAAVDPAKPPKTVRTTDPLGPSIANVPQSKKLQVGIVPGMITPLSEMAVEADVFRIHVADTPSPVLAKLADAAVLAEAVPDLTRFGGQAQIWTELALTGPIGVVEVPGKSPSLETKDLKLKVSFKADAASTGWKPYAEFDVSLRQSFTPSLAKPTSLTRAVSLTPDGPAQIEIVGRFAPGYTPQVPEIDNSKIQALFAAGWDDFITYGGPPQVDLPDVDFGYTMLRADDVLWSSPDLAATFGPPGVKITNSSDKPLVYETKGPYSDFGGPYTLQPGQSHDFPIAYPMIFRRRNATGYQMFTLPVGSHSEYRTKAAGTPENLYKAREPAEIEKAVESVPAPPDVKK
ncbi:MAG TPA: alpha/beta hydrolase-fold protein [Planctomycetaceae bacterium]|jgi:poly(3-hydroxybutyrate) depolymerase